MTLIRLLPLVGLAKMSRQQPRKNIKKIGLRVTYVCALTARKHPVERHEGSIKRTIERLSSMPFIPAGTRRTKRMHAQRMPADQSASVLAGTQFWWLPVLVVASSGGSADVCSMFA